MGDFDVNLVGTEPKTGHANGRGGHDRQVADLPLLKGDNRKGPRRLVEEATKIHWQEKGLRRRQWRMWSVRFAKKVDGEDVKEVGHRGETIEPRLVEGGYR